MEDTRATSNESASEVAMLTPAQVAKRMQVERRTVYKWLSKQKLKAVQIGRIWRVKLEDYQEFTDRYESLDGRRAK